MNNIDKCDKIKQILQYNKEEDVKLFLQQLEELLKTENYNYFTRFFIIETIKEIIKINITHELNLDDKTFIQWIKNILQISQKDADCLDTILSCLKNYYYYKFPREFINLILNPEFSKAQINEIINGFVECLNINDIKIYAHKHFNPQQMREIRIGLKQVKIHQLTYNHIITYAKPEIDWKIMYIIRKIYSIKEKRNINFDDLMCIINNNKNFIDKYNTYSELDELVNIIIQEIYKTKVEKIFNSLYTNQNNDNNITTKSFKF